MEEIKTVETRKQERKVGALFQKLTMSNLEELEGVEPELIDVAFEELRKIISLLKPLLSNVGRTLVIAGFGCGYRSKYTIRAIELEKYKNGSSLYLSEHGTFSILSFCDWGGEHFHVHALDVEAIKDIPLGRIRGYLKNIALQIRKIRNGN